jgi:hypothetical protein
MSYYKQNYAQTIASFFICLTFYLIAFQYKNILRSPFPFSTFLIFLIPRFIYFIFQFLFSSSISLSFSTPFILVLQGFNYFSSHFILALYFDGVEKNRKDLILIFRKKYLTKYYLLLFSLPIILLLNKL